MVEEQGDFILFDLYPTHVVNHRWYLYSVYAGEFCHAGVGRCCCVDRRFFCVVLRREGPYDAVFKQVVKGSAAFFLLDLFPYTADDNIRYFYG